MDSRLSKWFFAAIVTALLGALVSAYSVMHHLEVKAKGTTDAVCNINESMSCDDVALSEYSEVFGFPLGVWGLGYFLAIIVLLAVAKTNSKASAEHLHGYTALVVIGVAASVVLASISFFQIGAGCPTCIVIYALTFLQAAIWLGLRSGIPSGMNAKSVFNGGTTAAIVVAVVVAGFSFARPALTPETASTAKPTGETAATGDQPLNFAPQVQEIPIATTAYSGLGEDYRKGDDQAKVTIVEFADFECPACANMSATLEALKREFGDRIRVVFRNYPLDSACNSSMSRAMHPNACSAAVLARCAGSVGKFWAYHDLVFNNQRQISEEQLKTWARSVGLTDSQIDNCLASPDILAKIKDDVQLGHKIGVDATPTIFINGRKYIGSRGYEDLRTAIEDLL